MGDDGVPYLQSLHTLHAVRLLMAAVAFLSFTAGILHIGKTTVEGPLSTYIPLWLQATAGFAGAFTGFLVLAATIGVWRQYRAAWKSAVVLMPVVALQGILQASVLSLPLIIVSLLTLLMLIVTRNRFHRHIGLTPTQEATLAAVIGSQVYGTAGAYALRDHFTQDLMLPDAFYYSIVTTSTVGYGDIVPETTVARMFTVSLILVGVGSFTAFIGSMLGPFIKNQLPKHMEKLGRRPRTTILQDTDDNDQQQE